VSETSPECGEPAVDGLSWRERHTDGVIMLVIYGELDYWSGARLEQHLQSLAAAHHGRIVLDVAGLGFCDAGGVGVLVRGHARAQEQEGWLRLAGGDRRIRHLLRVVSLTGVLPMFESVGDAVSGRLPGR
jgi:anti-sigma B factor antagonist/stage II sporulation protein AA (anti-sigma F factor antagonist)